MDTIPIAELAQGSARNSTKSIRAVVTLLWPYSSSTHRAALLLAEPDFRLRNKRGQVRVQLADAAAKAVAESKISSGDEVVLHLEGAKWVEAAAGISTPGRSVDIELEYKRRIICKIFRGNQVLKQLDVDDQTPSGPSSPRASPSTPHAPYFPSLTPNLGRTVDLSTPESSAFHRRARVVSGELVDSPYDPFANDRESLGHNRKRQRLSWPSESRWTVNDNVPSPSKRRTKDDWIQSEDLQSPRKIRERVSPPSLPRDSSPTVTATESGTREGRERYTQELVDLISGDTEEEDFSLLVDAHSGAEDDDGDVAAVSSAFSKPQTFEGLKFTVFRDQPSSVIPSMAESQNVSISDIDAVDTQLSSDEKAFFILPSSDPILEPSAIEMGFQDQIADDEENVKAQEDGRHSGDGSLLSMHPLESPFPLHISDMPPPPILPTLQTSNLTSAFYDAMRQPPPPASALPNSPSTPDLRPQHSSALPLPSPFPGDELSSYMEAGHTPQQSSAFSPPTVTSPVLPDWMLQIGFGFGGGDLVDESGLGLEQSQILPDFEQPVVRPEVVNSKGELLEHSWSSERIEGVTEGDIQERDRQDPPRQTTGLTEPVEDAVQEPLPMHSILHKPHSTLQADSDSNSQILPVKKQAPLVIDLLDESDENESNKSEALEDEAPEPANASQGQVSSRPNDHHVSESPVPSRAATLETYDGALDFLNTSPPIPSLETTRRDVSLADLTNASANPATSTITKDTQDISMPFTPEGTQQSSHNVDAQGVLGQREVELPPTPRLTQATTMESLYSVSQRDAPISPPEIVNAISWPEETPRKSAMVPPSDGASSVLSPWFGVKSKVPDSSEQEHDVILQTFAAQPHTISGSLSLTRHDVDELEKDATATSSPETALVDFSFTQSQATRDHGILTDFSYYTPLNALFSSIRIPSNSQSYNNGCVDVIAIVTKATTRPLRAEKGQRDFHTTMSITDKLFYPRSLRVQVFRPWHVALPRAEKGDAVLLRGFEVFSAKGNVGVGLKSVNGAAWCVWRIQKPKAGEAEITAKPWTKRAASPSIVKDIPLDTKPSIPADGTIWANDEWREDVRGPPVELGKQERAYAKSLREWWVGEQAMSHE